MKDHPLFIAPEQHSGQCFSCTYVRSVEECPCEMINGCCSSSSSFHNLLSNDHKCVATTTCEIGSGRINDLHEKLVETHRLIFQEAVNLRGPCVEIWSVVNRDHYPQKGISSAVVVVASSSSLIKSWWKEEGKRIDSKRIRGHNSCGGLKWAIFGVSSLVQSCNIVTTAEDMVEHGTGIRVFRKLTDLLGKRREV